MFDQSFSAKNFYNILINENRRGNNLEKEFFRQEIFVTYTLEIKKLNSKLRVNLNGSLVICGVVISNLKNIRASCRD